MQTAPSHSAWRSVPDAVHSGWRVDDARRRRPTRRCHPRADTVPRRSKQLPCGSPSIPHITTREPEQRLARCRNGLPIAVLKSNCRRSVLPEQRAFANVPTQHCGVFVPGLLHNHPLTYAGHCRRRHQPRTQTMAAIIGGVHLNRRQGAFHGPRHPRLLSAWFPTWPQRSIARNTGPDVTPDSCSHASSAYFGHVASLVPTGIPFVKRAPS